MPNWNTTGWEYPPKIELDGNTQLKYTWIGTTSVISIVDSEWPTWLHYNIVRTSQILTGEIKLLIMVMNYLLLGTNY